MLSKLMNSAAMKDDLQSDHLVLLYDVARHMRTRADHMAQKHGMTRAKWLILARLKRQPGLSQNELAHLAEVAPITIARLIDGLEKSGLVERRPDPDDRRIWRLALTPKAEPHLREIERYRAEMLALITDGIDPGVLDAMKAGLQKMKENLAREASSAGQTGKKA